MPFNTGLAGQAQLFDTFLLVGGGPLRPRSIYEFDRLNYGWILKTQRLQKSRTWYPGVIAVPSDFVYCA